MSMVTPLANTSTSFQICHYSWKLSGVDLERSSLVASSTHAYRKDDFPAGSAQVMRLKQIAFTCRFSPSLLHSCERDFFPQRRPVEADGQAEYFFRHPRGLSHKVHYKKLVHCILEV
ncbi:hypothetical protein Zmor_011753 [Zophobas morio]|uniref:Uncharacterized protein n=1 Tax=Zophobas morio TaxID=2755281 RepID=A0AA38HHB8_9CUCU|nr:hypothetical protein Zmor_011753 [Zophobas morio]